MPAPRPYRERGYAKLRTPPEKWTPDWLELMDARFKAMAFVKANLEELENDLSAGDPSRLSWAQHSLAGHSVWAHTILENMERQFARGEDIDVGRFAQLLGVFNRISVTLGIQRRQRKIPKLEEYVGEQQDQAA
jgi:hypothetical protein